MYTLIKTKIKFSSYIRKFTSGAVAKSYMRKGFLILYMRKIRKCANISPYMRRPLVPEFPSIWGKFDFLFISALLRRSHGAHLSFPLPGQNGDAGVQNYDGGPDVDENNNDSDNALNRLHRLDVPTYLLDPLLNVFTPPLEVFKTLLDPLQEVFTLQLQPSAVLSSLPVSELSMP